MGSRPDNADLDRGRDNSRGLRQLFTTLGRRLGIDDNRIQFQPPHQTLFTRRWGGFIN